MKRDEVYLQKETLATKRNTFYKNQNGAIPSLSSKNLSILGRNVLMSSEGKPHSHDENESCLLDLASQKLISSSSVRRNDSDSTSPCKYFPGKYSLKQKKIFSNHCLPELNKQSNLSFCSKSSPELLKFKCSFHAKNSHEQVVDFGSTHCSTKPLPEHNDRLSLGSKFKKKENNVSVNTTNLNEENKPHSFQESELLRVKQVPCSYQKPEKHVIRKPKVEKYNQHTEQKTICFDVSLSLPNKGIIGRQRNCKSFPIKPTIENNNLPHICVFKKEKSRLTEPLEQKECLNERKNTSDSTKLHSSPYSISVKAFCRKKRLPKMHSSSNKASVLAEGHSLSLLPVISKTNGIGKQDRNTKGKKSFVQSRGSVLKLPKSDKNVSKTPCSLPQLVSTRCNNVKKLNFSPKHFPPETQCQDLLSLKNLSFEDTDDPSQISSSSWIYLSQQGDIAQNNSGISQAAKAKSRSPKFKTFTCIVAEPNCGEDKVSAEPYADMEANHPEWNSAEYSNNINVSGSLLFSYSSSVHSSDGILYDVDKILYDFNSYGEQNSGNFDDLSTVEQDGNSSIGISHPNTSRSEYESPVGDKVKQQEQTENNKPAIQWTKGNLLGKGAFGKVWCGMTSTGDLIAVKQIHLNVRNVRQAKQEYHDIQQEVKMLQSLRHHNIVSYLGTELVGNTVNILMQYISGGSIAHNLSQFGPFSESVILHYSKQILEGVSYLHQNEVIHRDIKGANIMVMPCEPQGLIKLIDFGCAKKMCFEFSDSLHYQNSVKGTPYWMSPEVICEKGCTTKSDIWSIGCTVIEMATTKPPWNELSPLAAAYAIGQGTSEVKLPDKLSALSKDFILYCMKRNPEERPTAYHLLGHPFILSVSQ